MIETAVTGVETSEEDVALVKTLGLPSPTSGSQLPIQPPDQLSSRLPGNFQPASQPASQPPDQPAIRLATHPASQPPDLNLSRSQIKVLAYLCSLPNRFTNRPAIQAATGLRYGTLSDAILALKRKGYLKTKFEKSSEVSGFTFQINELLCERFFFFNQSASQPPGRLPDQSANWLSEVPLCRSSNIKTTSEKGLEILHIDPELDYWLRKGLTTQQIQTWLTETETDLEVLVASLRHAAFELKDLEGEEKREVKNCLNYFYSIYKKNHFWAKPHGYKSHKQKEIEFKEEIMRQQEAEDKRLTELAIGEEFETMMNNPEGELYKRIEAKLKPFARAKDDHSPIRRATMRDIFIKDIVESE